MRILIFGATGSVGEQVTEQALERGHHVTAFARSADKMEPKPNLKTICGDVLNFNDVSMAFHKTDSVISTIGAGKKGRVRSVGTGNIISAMAMNGVSRLVSLSTLGAGESRANLDFFWKHVMFGFLLRDAYNDHQTQEKLIKESNLDWTIVRPGAFTHGPLTRQFRHGFDPGANGLKLKISRADTAWFMLEQLESDHYLCEAPGLSY